MLGRALRLLRRARQRRPGDLWARARREVVLQARRPWDRLRPFTLTERALLRALDCATIDELWDRLTETPFFLHASDRRRWRDAFDRIFPASRHRIVDAADAIVRHEFDLLGSGSMCLGDRLPWHTDFKSGRTWPLVWSRDIDPNELEIESDVKVPWELSRCQHFARLGQAWWLTDDPRYPAEFAAEVDDWLDANPYTRGVNWICPMDAALRAISWIWALHFFADADACRAQAFRSRLMRSLYLHGEFIAANPEIDEVNGNHYLADAVGLVYLGVLFQRTPAGARWLVRGRDMVLAEIDQQTHPDGTGIEQSIAYHRLVLELFLHAGLLLRAAGRDLPRTFWQRLERMHEFTCAYTKPDGHAPLIGDADDGRVQTLGLQPLHDHRYLLSTAAVLFDRADFKASAGDFSEETFWMLGPDARVRFDAIDAARTTLESQAFGDGGFYVLRNSLVHLVADCGDVGLKGLGGHGHNDILSFDLSMYGDEVITDSGAYLYTSSREWRNRFRSTAFHNTLQVDGEELNRFTHPDDLWRLRHDAVPADVQWTFGNEWLGARASHTGYRRLAAPLIHTRTFVLHRVDPLLLIADRIEGSGSHDLVWRFHFAPNIRLEIAEGAVRLDLSGHTIWMYCMSQHVPSLSLDTGWISRGFGRKEPRPVLVARATRPAPFECLWVLTGNPHHREAQWRQVVAEVFA